MSASRYHPYHTSLSNESQNEMDPTLTPTQLDSSYGHYDDSYYASRHPKTGGNHQNYLPHGHPPHQQNNIPSPVNKDVPPSPVNEDDSVHRQRQSPGANQLPSPIHTHTAHSNSSQPPSAQQAAQQQSHQLQAAQQIAQQQMLQAFWTNQLTSAEQQEPDFKTHTLPIARIKKVMRSDEEVKTLMISAEAPILFAKACEIFIEELTLRAWMHAEENKRRTIQKSDIATAVSKSDMYDFLIDIVPRESELSKAYSSATPKSPTKFDDLYGSATAENPYAYAYHPAAMAHLASPQDPSLYSPYHPDQMQQYHHMQLQYQHGGHDGQSGEQPSSYDGEVLTGGMTAQQP